MKPLVIIESPYSGNLTRNRLYLRECILDSITRGEVPFASHGFYPQFLDDNNEAERTLGMVLGWEIMARATKVAVYEDFGISAGMKLGIETAERLHLYIDYRKIKP